jgi:GTP-dependent phosphoenolpyruvate carboxykinase
MGSNNAREIYNRIEIDRTEENSVLIEVIEEFIELTESNKISKQTISKEEKEIIEKMNDLSDENIVLPD